jgi:hypothetical protein
MPKDDIGECQAILKRAVEKLYPGCEALFDPKHVMYVSMKVLDSNGDILFTSPDYVEHSRIWDMRNKPEEIKKTLRNWEELYQRAHQTTQQ